MLPGNFCKRNFCWACSSRNCITDCANFCFEALNKSWTANKLCSKPAPLSFTIHSCPSVRQLFVCPCKSVWWNMSKTGKSSISRWQWPLCPSCWSRIPSSCSNKDELEQYYSWLRWAWERKKWWQGMQKWLGVLASFLFSSRTCEKACHWQKDPLTFYCGKTFRLQIISQAVCFQM